jgi:hypothetical protein
MKNLKIRLENYERTYTSRFELERAINKTGTYCIGSYGDVGFVGRRNTRDTSLVMYSIEKHRAKKTRNKNGKYVVKQKSKWILRLTYIPLDLLPFLPKGTEISQKSNHWTIGGKK